MSAPSTSPPAAGAVFLSYASQDAEAAKRLCAALRTAGVEVWFDQNELVGGDAWDAKIRQQIAACALFVPILSANTQARLEGYFRIEWKLAARRTHAMATAKAFLLPVVIDATRDAEAHVPDEFRDVQWTRLPGAEAPEKFCARVQALLGSEGRDPVATRRPSSDAKENTGRLGDTPRTPKPARAWLLPTIIAGAAIVGLAIWRPWMLRSTRTAFDPNSPPSSRSAEGALAPVERTRALLMKVDVTRAELELAEEMMVQAAKVEPTNAEVFAAWTLVDCRFLEKNYDYSAQRKDAARRHAAQATSLAPESFEVRFARMESLRRLASDDSSRAEVRRLLDELRRQRPDDPRVLIASAWITYWAGDLNEALAYLTQTERLPQSTAVAKFTGGLMRAFSGDFAMGLASIEEAVNLQPAVEFLLWKSYLEVLWLGDTKRAQQTLSRVPPEFFLEDMPASAKFFVLLRARDYDGALNSVRTIPRDYMQSGAGAVPTGYFRGLALSFLGRTAAAESEWQSALATVDQRLAQARNDPNLLKSRALLLSALGRKKEAADVWRTNRELEGVDKWGWLGVSYAAHQLEPDILAEDIRQLVRDGHRWITAAELRLNPIYDRARDHPAIVALQAEYDRNPKHAPSALAVAPAPDAKSVAVLAFKNLSGDPAREFFSDGLSEAVSDVLGRVPGLKVVGSASAFSFKGKSVPIPEIARQLGVTHVVEGTVLQDGTAVRITAKLIQADGFQVWVSDKLDRELKNIFALHDEVAGLIAQNLSLKLGVDARRPRQEIDLEAYQLYLQARQAWSLRNSEGLTRAEELLERSLKFEPDYAQAHVALADVWSARSGQAGVLGTFDQRQSSEKARILAKIDHALRLDPDSAEARASLGSLAWYDWDFVTAERELRRAVSLNPNYATAHQWLGRSLQGQGRMEEALAALRRAAEIDPLSPVGLANYCGRLVEAGRDAESLAVAERGLTLLPNGRALLMHKGHALANLGRRPEAAAVARQLAATDPTDPNNLFPAVFILACAGETAEATAMMATLPDRGRLPRTALLLALGRREDAIAALDPSAQNVNFIGLLLFDRRYDSIRGEPRFAKFLAELGLTEAHARAQAWRKAHPPESPSAK